MAVTSPDADQASPDPAVLRLIHDVVHPFVARLDTPPPAVQQGSAIDELDRRLGEPYYLSQQVGSALTPAVDQLASVWHLLFKAGVIHAWGCASLARSAMEAAATAAWLLPDDPHLRCERALRLYSQNSLDQLRFTREYQAVPERIEALERRRELAVERASQLSVNASEVRKGVTTTAILRGVQPFGLDSPLTPLVLWMLLSGITHGRVWAAAAGHQYEIVEERDGGVVARFSSEEKLLLVAVQTAARLYDHALKTFNQGRLFFNESPARPRR